MEQTRNNLSPQKSKKAYSIHSPDYMFRNHFSIPITAHYIIFFSRHLHIVLSVTICFRYQLTRGCNYAKNEPIRGLFEVSGVETRQHQWKRMDKQNKNLRLTLSGRVAVGGVV